MGLSKLLSITRRINSREMRLEALLLARVRVNEGLAGRRWAASLKGMSKQQVFERRWCRREESQGGRTARLE